MDKIVRNPLGRLKVCVLGDIMLDVYRTIEPVKLSAEAPVVVGTFQHDTFCPGGAANAAANCAALGAETNLIGYIGNDHTGKILANVLQKNFLVGNAWVCLENWDTIRKERIVDSQGHQFVRIDTEVVDPITKKSSTATLRKRLRANIIAQSLLISDYDKGTCNLVAPYAIRLFKKAGKFVVVNGKPCNLEQYKGADVVTMNEAEWKTAYFTQFPSGHSLSFSEQILHGLRKLLPGTTLVMTRGSESMKVLEPRSHVCAQYRPQRVDVADVVGAGDTLAATLAVIGDSGPEAFYEAIKRASEVVQYKGTAVPKGAIA